MGLIVVISLNSITVQASSDDTTLSSMYKIDELIQNYGDKTPYIHTGNKTFTDAQLAEMVTDLETYLSTKDTSTQLKKMEAITQYVAERVYYNLNDKRYNPEGTELSSDDAYDVWSTKKGVCGGYSNLLSTLMITENIPTLDITSKNHAYNVCYDSDNSKWIYVDATGCSGNRYTTDNEWKTDPYTSLFFNLKVSTLASTISGLPYSISYLEKDGVRYLYHCNDSNYNTSVNINTWKDTEKWNIGIIGPSDSNLKVLKADNLGGYPITKIYAGFAGTDIESVDLSETKLERIVTPTTKSAGSFEGCTKLKTVKLPDTVKEIEVKAFQNCTSLESINMPKSISVIQSNVFLGCTSLKEIDFTGTDLASIGGDVFKGCTALTAVTFGEREKLFIGDYAFDGCSALTTVDCTGTKIKTLGYYSFTNCTSLESIDLSDSAFTTTNQRMFYKCTSLKEVKLPATLEKIEYNAFYNTAIKTLDLSNTAVTTIGYQGCAYMNALRTVYLPSTLETLDDYAFFKEGTTVRTRIYSDLSEDQIRTISNNATNVWANRHLSFPTGNYTLSYNGNGATSGTMADETHIIEANPVPFYLTINVYAREGYHFTGWNTAADGSGTNYKDRAAVSAPLTDVDQATVTLYAMWEEDAKEPENTVYNITYVLNGGTNNTANPDTYTSETATITLKDPTKEGYTFLGWYLDEDYTKKTTEIPTGNTGNVTLYAKWEQKEQEDVCEHEWIDGDVLTPATCRKTGTKTRTCSICSKTEVVTIPKDSTNHVNTVIRYKKAATTTSTGYTGDTYCKDCYKTIKKGSVIPKLSSSNSSTGTTQKPNNKPNNQAAGTNKNTTTKANNQQTSTSNVTAATAPSVVRGVKVVNKKSKTIKISWKKQSNVGGYEIQYALNRKFKKSLKKLKATSSASSKTVKKLKKKKTYYVRVRAYTVVGSKKVYSGWSTIKKIKIKR